MFNNVLVGIDSPEGGGRDAIALARWLARDGAKITLAHIFQGDASLSRAHSLDYDRVQIESARTVLERARAEAGIEASLIWAGSPSVGRGLHEVVDRTSADLLVVGSSRHGLVGRVMLGDDTEGALSGAGCAVAIAPAGYASRPVLAREIGVGYDGSPESEYALEVGRGLAAAHDARLAAFEAVPIPTAAFTAPVPSEDWIESMVEQARERVGRLEGVEPHAVYGRPVEELALFSASVDLLIVGSRGYGPLGRLVHGSTSRHLARTARCPLLILPRGAGPTSAPDNGATSHDAAVASSTSTTPGK